MTTGHRVPRAGSRLAAGLSSSPARSRGGRHGGCGTGPFHRHAVQPVVPATASPVVAQVARIRAPILLTPITPPSSSPVVKMAKMVGVLAELLRPGNYRYPVLRCAPCGRCMIGDGAAVIA